MAFSICFCTLFHSFASFCLPGLLPNNSPLNYFSIIIPALLHLDPTSAFLGQHRPKALLQQDYPNEGCHIPPSPTIHTCYVSFPAVLSSPALSLALTPSNSTCSFSLYVHTTAKQHCYYTALELFSPSPYSPPWDRPASTASRNGLRSPCPQATKSPPFRACTEAERRDGPGPLPRAFPVSTARPPPALRTALLPPAPNAFPSEMLPAAARGAHRSARRRARCKRCHPSASSPARYGGRQRKQDRTDVTSGLGAESRDRAPGVADGAKGQDARDKGHGVTLGIRDRILG